MKSKDRKRFSHRIDLWDEDGENVLEHLAGVEDFAQIQEYARVRARESSKVSREPTGTLTPIDVDARPNRNSRDCFYAVTQFGRVS